MTQDLTVGKPISRIWQFAVPVLFGLLLQQVYSLVDTAIVGHALGVMALGGVGATGSVNFLVLGFCGGLCTGMAIPLAPGVRRGRVPAAAPLCGGLRLAGTYYVGGAAGRDASGYARAAAPHGNAGGADGLRVQLYLHYFRRHPHDDPL